MVKGKDEKDMTNAKVTRGILFFGVPSQGMEIDSLREMVAGQANEPFLQSLRQDSDTLRNQSRQFCELFPFESCEIISFFETELSPTVKKASSSSIHYFSSDIGSTPLIVAMELADPLGTPKRSPC